MIAVIPTIGLAPQLPTLVDQLLSEGMDEVLLSVNEWEAFEKLPLKDCFGLSHRVVRCYRAGSIYAGWNWGIRRAKQFHQILAVLNDDIALEPEALRRAEEMMAQHPKVVLCGLDYGRTKNGPFKYGQLNHVKGTYQYGGLAGWAFIADASRTPQIDTPFEWWYGDDDLVLQVLANGDGVAVAGGCRVEHTGEASANQRAWTHDAKIRDEARFLEKWG